MTHDDDANGFTDLTNKDLLRILMQEIADVRLELKNDIQGVDQKVDQLAQKVNQLDKKIDQVDKNVRNLTVKVDQNHLSFMTNIEDVSERVSTLETTVR